MKDVKMKMKRRVSTACVLALELLVVGCHKKHEPIDLEFVSIQRSPSLSDPYIYTVAFSANADLKRALDNIISPSLRCIIGSPEKKRQPISDTQELEVSLFMIGGLDLDAAKPGYLYTTELYFVNETHNLVRDTGRVAHEIQESERQGGDVLCQVVITGYDNKDPDDSSFIAFWKYWFSRPFYSGAMTFPTSELTK